MLDGHQRQERIDTMVVLNLNLSLCHFKRGVAFDSIKHAKDAVALDESNAKAHYRLAIAYKLNNDLDPAKDHFVQAIKLQPSNQTIRQEYN